MTSSIHDDVKAALNELQKEASELEHVAGNELVRLYDSLRATVQAIRSAKRGLDYQAPEIKAGAGAIEDPLHPHTAATEAAEPTAEQVEERAQREPDPAVRDKIRAGSPETVNKSSRAKK